MAAAALSPGVGVGAARAPSKWLLYRLIRTLFNLRPSPAGAVEWLAFPPDRRNICANLLALAPTTADERRERRETFLRLNQSRLLIGVRASIDPLIKVNATNFGGRAKEFPALGGSQIVGDLRECE